MKRDPVAFGAAALAALATASAGAADDPKSLEASNPITAKAQAMIDQPYAGMWVTADGRVRHELLPDGRYVEARGSVEGAYRGRYEITGDHIEYRDNTVFTADGDFIDGVLHHAGMVLRRR